MLQYVLLFDIKFKVLTKVCFSINLSGFFIFSGCSAFKKATFYYNDTFGKIRTNRKCFRSLTNLQPNLRELTRVRLFTDTIILMRTRYDAVFAAAGGYTKY